MIACISGGMFLALVAIFSARFRLCNAVVNMFVSKLLYTFLTIRRKQQKLCIDTITYFFVLYSQLVSKQLGGQLILRIHCLRLNL